MAALSADPWPTWTLVVPVKVLARAKSRLASLAGQHRPALALAMAVDTVAAALACPQVGEVVVVTADPRAVRALTALGVEVVPDEPGPGLNAALRHGARVARTRRPGWGVAALTADLPALKAVELGRALREAARHQQAFVPDAAGSGTTLYTARADTEFRPRFGEDSAARHRSGGAAELLLPGLDSLRRDVDAGPDLWAAAELGLGTRTGAVLTMIRPVPDESLRCGRSGR